VADRVGSCPPTTIRRRCARVHVTAPEAKGTKEIARKAVRCRPAAGASRRPQRHQDPNRLCNRQNRSLIFDVEAVFSGRQIRAVSPHPPGPPPCHPGPRSFAPHPRRCGRFRGSVRRWQAAGSSPTFCPLCRGPLESGGRKRRQSARHRTSRESRLLLAGRRRVLLTDRQGLPVGPTAHRSGQP
jgi:hypothetical protein